MIGQIDRHFARLGPGRVAARVFPYVFIEGRPVGTKGKRWTLVVLRHLDMVERRSTTDLSTTALSDTVELSYTPVFIVGVGRSGTTLLGRLLAAHAGVTWLNEPKAVWQRVHPKEDVSGYYGRPGDRSFFIDPNDVEPNAASNLRKIYSYVAEGHQSYAHRRQVPGTHVQNRAREGPVPQIISRFNLQAPGRRYAVDPTVFEPDAGCAWQLVGS